METIGRAKSALGDLVHWTASLLKKRVFFFEEGSKDDKGLLGVKGANLCEMYRLGIPISPGFVITSEVCKESFEVESNELPEFFISEYTSAIKSLEEQTCKVFGNLNIGDDEAVSSLTDSKYPMLVSVRSCPSVSMPGMLDTILNLGINDEAVDRMTRLSNNPRWAFDTYRRFLQSFGIVVMKVNPERYLQVLAQARIRNRVEHDSGLNAIELQRVILEFKAIVAIPQNPWDQLRMALTEVYASWHSSRAVKYRELHHIPHTAGVAITEQAMVHGNLNPQSGCGNVFTRDPNTGDQSTLYGEYLPQSNGDDIGSGERTPVAIWAGLGLTHVIVYEKLMSIAATLESHFRDMQEIEFTLENGQLFILQSSAGKRTPSAAVKIACSMVNEKLISERDALLRLDPTHMDYFLYPRIDMFHANNVLVGTGQSACNGAAVGQLAFTVEDAIRCSEQDIACILCREHASTDDIAGFMTADGLIAIHGGITSHAAVIMRDLGKPSVIGSLDMRIEWDDRHHHPIALVNKDSTCRLTVGDVVTIDGDTGRVFQGRITTHPVGIDEYYRTVMEWAGKYQRMKVTASCFALEHVYKAMEYNADSIGLLKTESMFLRHDRIDLVRELLLTDSVEMKGQLLAKLTSMHQIDFLRMFQLFDGRSMTVRLLNCSLQTFLPLPTTRDALYEAECIRMAMKLHLSLSEYLEWIRAMQEEEPSMMGVKGARLAVLRPEIVMMQVKAIVGAVVDAQRQGFVVFPRILIPSVSSEHEAQFVLALVQRTISIACDELKVDMKDVQIMLGVQMDTPRLCLQAGSLMRLLAKETLDFVSIDLTSLTQCILGMSKDDSSQLLTAYLSVSPAPPIIDQYLDNSPDIANEPLHPLLSRDPFHSMDRQAVGVFVEYVVKHCKDVFSHFQVTVTGTQCSDPDTIHQLNNMDVDAITCSPYKLSGVKIAAAQAFIEHDRKSLPQHYLEDAIGALLGERHHELQ